MPRLTSTVLLMLILSHQPSLAQTPDIAQPMVSRLQTEGYTVTEVSRTWLGRILITATTEGHLREIVLNRTTGEILRDRLFPLRSSDGTTETPPPPSVGTDPQPVPDLYDGDSGPGGPGGRGGPGGSGGPGGTGGSGGQGGPGGSGGQGGGGASQL
ncbi:hypothetical protein TRL7639_02207 [Falsiruegeria litorea R37]|uniref:PepSY domain-containing protein n=1 Tax=Falsiruegeria litorea R37 TaxID=1200284 RepID=A0A1Y5SKJ0_9RHOB|nr:hypothetical protein [Falsiruegeria litorea]SLN42754.1 hypothetical protein TRL7639_02207 [Falsiruegeria litorea R37]